MRLGWRGYSATEDLRSGHAHTQYGRVRVYAERPQKPTLIQEHEDDAISFSKAISGESVYCALDCHAVNVVEHMPFIKLGRLATAWRSLFESRSQSILRTR